MFLVIAIVLAIFLIIITFGGSMNTTFPTPNQYANADLLQKVATGIGKAEGFGIAGAIPTRANNPGDLVEGDKGLGTLGQARITVFKTVQDGLNHLYGLLNSIFTGQSTRYSLDMDFYDFAEEYVYGEFPGTLLTPDQQTQVNGWAETVASVVGVDPSVTLGSLVG